jgi:chromate transporter
VELVALRPVGPRRAARRTALCPVCACVIPATALRGRSARSASTSTSQIPQSLFANRAGQTLASRVPDARPHPTFAEAFRFWLKLGFISFGGPTGQIAIMHEELVERRRWISEARFLHALNYCMLLPGPEATQLATYIGWLLHRTRGGLAAGALFVLPSALLLWLLSFIYMTWGAVPWVAAVFYGLKPAVLALIAAAMLRIGGKTLKNSTLWTIAALAFAAIFILHVPFPVIVLGAALVGFAGEKIWRDKFVLASAHRPKETPGSVLDDHTTAPAHARPSLARAVKVLVVSLVLWFTPLAALAWWLGTDHALFREGVFFSKAALVTFGGAYAVLPYVAQQAVENYQWLTAAQMLDGLGLAETTPGPLIMVLQFVGFVGAWQHPGELPRLLSATLGAAITTWVTFVPCFLWIFLGAPHIETMRGNAKLTAALTAVTAAVVGVILNLAVTFGEQVLFPGLQRVEWFACAVALIAFAGLWRWKWNVIAVVFGAGAAGLIFKMIAG